MNKNKEYKKIMDNGINLIVPIGASIMILVKVLLIPLLKNNELDSISIFCFLIGWSTISIISTFFYFFKNKEVNIKLKEYKINNIGLFAIQMTSISTITLLIISIWFFYFNK